MITYKKFTGLNNVLPPERLKSSELSIARNVDVGMDGELTRRDGFVSTSGTAHRNLHQADGFLLATRGTGDLVNTTSGATLYPALGNTRVWYCNLPDGRTTFSNGLINGVVSATARTTWGVPIPSGIGAFTDIAGSLHPGSYQYSLTHVRTSDGLEGGPAYSGLIEVASGGVFLSGLPVLADHSMNVYLTSHGGATGFFAGSTTVSTFVFSGQNKDLVLPCRTDFLSPAPVGTVSALWNGRVLVAVGDTLYASRHGQYELFDLRRDFKSFSGAITLIQPTESGVFVGTTKELAYLAGTQFDKLVYAQVIQAGVVLGSGVEVDGELIALGEGVGKGRAMVCIADRMLVAGFDGGLVSRLTEGRYVSSAAEVRATFRQVDGLPQYIAVVQT